MISVPGTGTRPAQITRRGPVRQPFDDDRVQRTVLRHQQRAPRHIGARRLRVQQRERVALQGRALVNVGMGGVPRREVETAMSSR